MLIKYIILESISKLIFSYFVILNAVKDLKGITYRAYRDSSLTLRMT